MLHRLTTDVPLGNDCRIGIHIRVLLSLNGSTAKVPQSRRRHDLTEIASTARASDCFLLVIDPLTQRTLHHAKSRVRGAQCQPDRTSLTGDVTELGFACPAS